MDGILVLLKPPGMTSHDVVDAVRRLLGERRVGHTGTLDPGAAGILVICIGNATRLIPFMEDCIKGYRAEVWFGRSTDTQDAGGETVAELREFAFTDEDLLAALTVFQGEVEQIPPMVSALKHEGQRLYTLARQGKTVERKPRKVKIFQLEPVGSWRRGEWHYGDTLLFDVVCSKGTYIRTLCQDLGEYLQVPSHMSFLVRTRVGRWSLQDALTLEELAAAADEFDLKTEASSLSNLSVLIPMDVGVEHLPGAVLSKRGAERMRHGSSVPAEYVEKWLEPTDFELMGVAGDPSLTGDLIRIYDNQDRFLGIGRTSRDGAGGILRPVRLLPAESR